MIFLKLHHILVDHGLLKVTERVLRLVLTNRSQEGLVPTNGSQVSHIVVLFIGGGQVGRILNNKRKCK